MTSIGSTLLCVPNTQTLPDTQTQSNAETSELVHQVRACDGSEDPLLCESREGGESRRESREGEGREGEGRENEGRGGEGDGGDRLDANATALPSSALPAAVSLESLEARMHSLESEAISALTRSLQRHGGYTVLLSFLTNDVAWGSRFKKNLGTIKQW
eukprot:CAMPEP_0173344858 /NCGR_PEP_ID=MMETSP1144-20121109/11643_1 /TAXON_ID=483371 /ORGANISM="non described non described, Strain CCMP2298" /LENGTH=158 /DNA_ID=CAMNT_0014291903 /DNA_START=314 /DNA_END=787 /DNA_ORIENTATION=-